MILCDLNGAWRCRGTDGNEHDFDIPATVPGCVHTDLQKAGLLPDLYYRDNADLCRWVETCDVTFTRSFSIDHVFENACLVFDGLDVYAEITLNGECVGETDDMFIPHVFPVGKLLRPGENTLTVKFRSPSRETGDLPRRDAAFGTFERLYTRRIQCTYGWDWVARFVTMGIFRSVRLEVPESDRPDNVYIYTESVGEYGASLVLRSAFKDLTGDGWADFAITSPDGETVWKTSRKLLPVKKNAADTVIEERFTLANPRLWFPAGYGEQPIYTLIVSAPGGEKTVPFGIRTARIVETDDAADSPEAALASRIKTYGHLVQWDRNEKSSSFILYVNGVRIFCRGGNWVPCEPFVSEETPEKIRSLVSLAKEGNCNMLRVWGGGIFEQDAFYDACDREGILVTQDFLMACGEYPEEDDAFIEKLGAEARYAALTLRNHPSLVWWSGDNENAVCGDENMPSYNGRRAALEAIGPVLRELDPARRFLPSSPYGGVPYASAVRGTTHNTQFLGNFFKWVRGGDFSDYRSFFSQYLARFCAEQPAIGMPYVSTLREFMTDEDIFGDDTSISEYHTKNNPGLGEITLYGYIDRMTRGIFGEYRDGADRVEKMQMLQCEWIRLSLELFRRNAWFSSGIIYWMFDDCWPAANGWSVVDYYGDPKPAFYAFKRAAQPFILSLSEENETLVLTASDLSGESKNGTYRLYRYDILSGREETLAEDRFAAPAGKASVLTACQMPELSPSEVILADGTGEDGVLDRAFFLPHRYADVPFRRSKFTVLGESETEITVRADETLPMLLLDVPYRLDRNGMFMKIGETVTLKKIR
ncbi:MAG: hypothetical protein MJ082_04230 [Clostridia bacterium]|nr:hypothetical protein [Clostridia bacterium]